MGKTRRERSFEDVYGAVQRFLKALAIRTGQADEFELGELVALRDDIEQAIVDAIRIQLSFGKSWQSIGDSLGISRQAAFKRYAHKVAASPLANLDGFEQSFEVVPDILRREAVDGQTALQVGLPIGGSLALNQDRR